MENLVHSLLSEPRSPGAPRRVWRDWLLVGTIAASTIIEALVRSEPTSLLLSAFVAGVLIVCMLWRRIHPLLSVAGAFGSVILINLAILVSDNAPGEIYGAVWILVLSYSLFRWGSGRQVAVGFGVILVTLASGMVVNFTGIGDAIGGATFLLFPAALGASVRGQRTARAQQAERVKLEERARIARELHDTVAHHVSAIAIAAQAGRFLAESDSPEGAANSLAVIEEEASRTLLEMRSMVGLLRQGGSDNNFAPQQGIAELGQLASNIPGNKLHVEIDLSGNLDSVSGPVSTAVFRLAQESVTNASRHARNATRVDVQVHGGLKVIRLTVSDDGEVVTGGPPPPGFGLIGMSERAELLGGSFQAGPEAEQGWAVRAELPRTLTNTAFSAS